MNTRVDHLNEYYEPDEELLIEHCSGYTNDHTDEILTRLAECDESHTCEAGHWVVVVDGEVVAQNEFHPSHVHITGMDE